MERRKVMSLFAKFLRRLALVCAILVIVSMERPIDAQGALAKITSGNADKLKLLATLTGHSGNALSLAFSPDGSLLASGSVDTTLRLWNVQNPAAAQPGAVLEGHTKQVGIVAFSADGKTVLSGGYDYTLRFWDVPTGKQTAAQGSKDTPGPMLASVINSFSPDMSVLLYSANGGAGLWDVKKGVAMQDDALTANLITWGWAVFTPDGKSFYLADVASNKIYQFPVPAGDGKVVLTGPDGTTYDGPMALSPDGSTLAAVTSTNESIHLFDVKSGKAQVIATGDQQDQYLLAYSPDGSLLISSGGDSTRLWDTKTGKQVSQFPEKQVLALAFNPAETLLAVALPQPSSTKPPVIELWGVPGQ